MVLHDTNDNSIYSEVFVAKPAHASLHAICEALVVLSFVVLHLPPAVAVKVHVRLYHR